MHLIDRPGPLAASGDVLRLTTNIAFPSLSSASLRLSNATPSYLDLRAIVAITRPQTLPTSPSGEQILRDWPLESRLLPC